MTNDESGSRHRTGPHQLMGAAKQGERCPLCNAEDTRLLWAGNKASFYRQFYLCLKCDLVHVPSRFFVSPDVEKARYLQHNNEVDDPEYRKFLDRLYSALKPHLKPGSKGLDYGAGPGPALAAMLREDGFDVRLYDPYFHPDNNTLADRYDFIVCTETAEHFRHPAKDLRELDSLLRRSGWLGIMTSMLENWDEFPSWHYHRDPTHVSFYSVGTMEWIANEFGWEVQFPRQHVALFQKRGVSVQMRDSTT